MRSHPKGRRRSVDRLLDDHSPEAIANILNARGSVSGYGKPFTGRMINRVRVKYGLKSRFERLRAKGMLTREEVQEKNRSLFDLLLDETYPWETLHEEHTNLAVQILTHRPSRSRQRGEGRES